MHRTIHLNRTIEFSPAIVWDALVDDDLVTGWLGDARIDPIVGGRFDLAWLGSPENSATSGLITVLDQPVRLVIETDVHGVVEFVLTEVNGGPRGTSSAVTVTVTVDLDARFEPRVVRMWSEALDQLDALLHGHAVDWGIVAGGPDADEAHWDVARTAHARAIRATHPNAIGTAP